MAQPNIAPEQLNNVVRDDQDGSINGSLTLSDTLTVDFPDGTTEENAVRISLPEGYQGSALIINEDVDPGSPAGSPLVTERIMFQVQENPNFNAIKLRGPDLGSGQARLHLRNPFDDVGGQTILSAGTGGMSFRYPTLAGVDTYYNMLGDGMGGIQYHQFRGGVLVKGGGSEFAGLLIEAGGDFGEVLETGLFSILLGRESAAEGSPQGSPLFYTTGSPPGSPPLLIGQESFLIGKRANDGSLVLRGGNSSVQFGSTGGQINLYGGNHPTEPSNILFVSDNDVKLRYNFTTDTWEFDTLISLESNPPASASDTGEAGQFTWDSSYLYICIATNTWRRVAHATWV